METVAIWIHVDTETLRPLRLGEELQAVCRRERGSRKANFRLGHPDPPGDGSARPGDFAPPMDIAGHVNNAAYWDLPEDRAGEVGRPRHVLGVVLQPR